MQIHVVAGFESVAVLADISRPRLGRVLRAGARQYDPRGGGIGPGLPVLDFQLIGLAVPVDPQRQPARPYWRGHDAASGKRSRIRLTHRASTDPSGWSRSMPSMTLIASATPLARSRA